MAESDDDRETARAAILQRRSRLIAYAVAVGACAPACGGVCLSMPPHDEGGTGGSEVAGASACLSGSGGLGGVGAFPCLSAGEGPTSTAGEGGVPGVIIIPGAAGESAGGEGGAGGESGGGPILCLSVK